MPGDGICELYPVLGGEDHPGEIWSNDINVRPSDRIHVVHRRLTVIYARRTAARLLLVEQHRAEVRRAAVFVWICKSSGCAEDSVPVGDSANRAGLAELRVLFHGRHASFRLLPRLGGSFAC